MMIADQSKAPKQTSKIVIKRLKNRLEVRAPLPPPVSQAESVSPRPVSSQRTSKDTTHMHQPEAYATESLVDSPRIRLGLGFNEIFL